MTVDSNGYRGRSPDGRPAIRCPRCSHWRLDDGAGLQRCGFCRAQLVTMQLAVRSFDGPAWLVSADGQTAKRLQ